MNKTALLIFAKNRIEGRVKTRLAATIGNAKTMEIYDALLQYTFRVVQLLGCDKIIFYSDYKEPDNNWLQIAETKVQQGISLGERMRNAFNYSFQSGYKKVIIIGTDCPELTTGIVEHAFDILNDKDVVIGPATDGGYYLLGIKKHQPQLFENIRWSTDEVLHATLQRCAESSLLYSLLPTLHDVDEEADLPYLKAIL